MANYPYIQAYDRSGDAPLATQSLNPATQEFLAVPSYNRRALLDQASTTMNVGELGVVPRGTKHILWSSEGYTPLGNSSASTAAVVAQSGARKIATNNSGAIDVSMVRNLVLAVSLTAITGTSIQFELDLLDDAGTPNSIAIWKPAAWTSATTSALISVGPGVAFAQAAAAPSTAATGFGAIAAPANWTFYNIPVSILPTAKVAWTCTAVSAATWTTILYGQY